MIRKCGNNRIWARYFLLILFPAAICSSCLFDPPREDAGGGALEARDFDSAENVLYNFALSHTLKDIALYSQCLDEQYRFLFTDQDVASIEDITESGWTKTSDVQAMENMFNNISVIEISFDYTVHPDTFWFGDNVEYNIEIDFKLLEEISGKYAHGIAEFTFDTSVPDSVRIIEILDRTW